MLPQSVSPSGDRLAFKRSSEDRTRDFLWTMPIDPETGIATAQAQRVSLRPVTSNAATFSPDGRMLVFLTGPRPGGLYDVVVVPVMGGAERVVVTYPKFMATPGWSADGQWLHVQGGSDYRAKQIELWVSSPRRSDGSTADSAIVGIPVAGGRSEPLVPRTPITEAGAVGLSPDERVAFFLMGPDRFFYRTASGLEGEISVSLPPFDDGGGATSASTRRCGTSR
jgi:hypothetical protein